MKHELEGVREVSTSTLIVSVGCTVGAIFQSSPTEVPFEVPFFLLQTRQVTTRIK